MRDISKSNGLRQEWSCQSGGDEEEGIVNKMQRAEAPGGRSGPGGGRQAGRGPPGCAAFPGPGEGWEEHLGGLVL